MSQINFVDTFIKIIDHYGFKISKNIVDDIIQKGKIKQFNKKINKKVKPIIGIHFHDKCCLNNSQITRHCNPQYAWTQTGWTHGCKACNSKCSYMNNKFQSSLCIDGGTLNSSDSKKQMLLYQYQCN